MVEYAVNGGATASYKHRKVYHRDNVPEMTEKDADTVSLQKSYGKKQQCKGRQCIAEGDKRKWDYKQGGTKYYGAIINDAG
jgi:hypothetical protein